MGFHIGSAGEEAAIVASAAAMREVDWIFPCYREFGALLWRGMPLQGYIDNMYGNSNDSCRGRQMPDHYSGKPYRFASVSSPIGTQLPQAVGFSWAAKLKDEKIAVAVYLGEGATSSADFHTAMNFAGVFQTPTVFLIRNNGWAISVPASHQTAAKSFADKGAAYGVPAVRVDGNDALAVYKTVKAAAEEAAAGEGSKLIEMLTYRMSGHSTSDDPRAYRSEQEVEAWQQKDPIVRLRKYLESNQAWSEKDESDCVEQLRTELKACIKKAEESERPSIASMFEDVYREKPWHLKEQQRQAEQGPRHKANH
ncbi:MAG: thiamine pyrophosphate-dependent dehydrogenase E1 component subunit alpha [Myxococcales bacterium]|nr:MAG: thiamine pyrophosphate-dependent dehydrogenase E1 component subunit alpha [Myxococcales bacterium]